MPITDRILREAITPKPKPVELMASHKPVFLRLPGLGPASLATQHRLEVATRKTVPWCKVMVCFSSRNAFNTCKKDVLPAEYTNNVVYLFSCECSNSYVGRTSFQLRERMGQHIPPEVINSVVGCEAVKRKRGGLRRHQQRLP